MSVAMARCDDIYTHTHTNLKYSGGWQRKNRDQGQKPGLLRRLRQEDYTISLSNIVRLSLNEKEDGRQGGECLHGILQAAGPKLSMAKI